MAHTHSELENETTHHEESDIQIGPIFKFVLYLTAVTVVVHIYVWFLMGSLDRQAQEASVIRYPLAAEQGERLPPLPRLQTLPRQELSDLRASWRMRLDGYSWVDKNAGTVRIPIDQAMKRVLDSGIPTRSAADAPAVQERNTKQ
ncbi:MAG: hypothetical protein AB7N65_06315 [Vicinamibacterales bacterium]